MIILNDNEIKFQQFLNKETRIEQTRLIVYEKSPNVIDFKYENDNDLLKLMFIKNYLDSFNKKSILNIWYMPYSRMDRSENGSVFTLKYVAEFVNSLNFIKVIINEPHSDVTPALINNCEVRYPSIYILKKVLNDLGNLFNRNKDYIYFPDAGAEKRYSKLIPSGLKTLVGIKHRDFQTGRITNLQLAGKVEGDFNVIMLDDLCSKGGTFILGATKLKEVGANNIYLVVGHCEEAIFEGDIFKTELIKWVATTNSIITSIPPGYLSTLLLYKMEELNGLLS